MVSNKPSFHGLTKASMHNVVGGSRKGGSRKVRVYNKEVILKPGCRIVYKSRRPYGIEDRNGKLITLF